MTGLLSEDLMQTILKSELELREAKEKWRKNPSVPKRHPQLIQQQILLSPTFLDQSVNLTLKVLENVDQRTVAYQNTVKKAGIRRVYLREPAETIVHVAYTDHLMSRILRSTNKTAKEQCNELKEVLLKRCPSNLWIWLLKTTYEWKVVTNWTILDCCAKTETADLSLRSERYQENFNVATVNKIDCNSVAKLEPTSSHATSAAVVKRFTDIIKSSMTAKNIEYTRLIDNVTILYTYLLAFLPGHTKIVDRIVEYYGIPPTTYQRMASINETFPTDLEYKLAFNNARLAYAINYIAGITISLESIFQKGRNESLAKLVLTATTLRYFKAIGSWSPAVRIFLDKLQCNYFVKNLSSISEYVGKYTKRSVDHDMLGVNRELDLKIMRDLGLWKSSNVDVFNAELLLQNQPGNFLPHFTLGKKMLLYHSIRSQIKIISSHLESKGPIATIHLLHCSKEDLLQVCSWIWQLASKEGSRKAAILTILSRYSRIMPITHEEIETVFRTKAPIAEERVKLLITYIMNVLSVKSYLVSYHMPVLSITDALKRSKNILGYFYLNTFDRLELSEEYFQLQADQTNFQHVVLTPIGKQEFEKVGALQLEIDLICMLLTIHLYWSYTSDVYKTTVNEREFSSTSYHLYNTHLAYTLGYLIWPTEEGEMRSLATMITEKNTKLGIRPNEHVQYIIESYMNVSSYECVYYEYPVIRHTIQDESAMYGIELKEEETYIEHVYRLTDKPVLHEKKSSSNTANSNDTKYVFIAMAPIVCDKGFYEYVGRKGILLYQYPVLDIMHSYMIIAYIADTPEDRDAVRDFVNKHLKAYELVQIPVDNKYHTAPFIMPNYLKNRDMRTVNYPAIFADLNHLDQSQVLRQVPINRVPYPLSLGSRSIMEKTASFIGAFAQTDTKFLLICTDIEYIAKYFLKKVMLTDATDVKQYCYYLEAEFIQSYRAGDSRSIPIEEIEAVARETSALKTYPIPSSEILEEFSILKSKVREFIMKRDSDAS